ncbi:MAG TPA: PAS domain S-box protein, partial [Anaerolineales bacterium]|nr:PAS domain S-box protein [Anaerolineales bacterium]
MTKANKKLTDNGNKLVSQTSLQLLPLIMQNIPQAVFWKDQNLVYLGCNRAFAEDAGFASPEDVIGKTDFDMPWKDQAEAYRADDQRVLDGGEPKLNYEEPQTTPNGSTIWLRTSKIPVCEDGRVVAILGMYEDITEHKQAELDLLLRDRALASSINAIVIISLLDNKPIYVNESLLRITGYTHEEALQLTLLDILDNPEETDKYIRSTQAQGFFIGEELIKRKDGSFFPASFSSSVITDAKGKPIAVQSSFFDITDRKQAETLQQQSERLFRALFEMSPDAVTLIDPYDPSGEWPIVDCNAATCHINGYTREELIGQPINIVNAPTNTPIDRVDYLKRLEEGQSIKYEIFHRRKNGEIFPVEVSTTMIKVGDRELLLGIDRDITERKQTEEALQENRSLYQSLVETSPLSICRKDLAGRFTFANQRFLKLSHTTLDELVGKTDFDLHPSELAEKYRSDDLAVMESGQVEEIIEERAVHEGETALVQTIKAPIYDGTGKVNGIQISFWDITDRKRAEATIRDSEERLRAIYEGTHDAVMILNEKGFFDCNSQTLKMFGYKTKEEFTSIHPADVSPASQPDGRDSMSASQEHIQTAYRQGYDRFEWVHRRNSGEDFPAEVLLSAFDLGGQRVLQATVREITERRQAEKAIQENEERFRRFTEATSEALIFHEQGKIVDVNPAALAMFGFAKEADVIGTNLLEFVAPESRALVMEKMQLGDVPPYEAICIRTDKTTFPIETRTRSYKFGDSIIRATSVRDITQRKKAEAQVQQEKSFSDAIINGLPGTFYLFDLQGKMVRWNKEYEKVSGYSAEEIPTMSVVDTLAEEDREAALTTIQRAMVEGQGAVEAKFICKDGRTIPYYFAGQRLQIGDQVYMAGTGMDLTERKKA